jgi:hypothetical protein
MSWIGVGSERNKAFRMQKSPQSSMTQEDEPLITLQEIVQQPTLWPLTVAAVEAASTRMNLAIRLQRARVLLTGAGSSAYAATGAALAWPEPSLSRPQTC